MFFNSFQYLLFLPAVAVVLYILPHKVQWLWLLVCSLFFYFLLSPEYLALFILVTAANYFAAIALEKFPAKQNLIFIIAICINVLLLAFFKYFGFLQMLVNDIQDFSQGDKFLKILLPAGLSFLIFTAISYLIEVKRGNIRAERHPGIFASYLMFFPKILQGPIERPGSLLHQFRQEKQFDYEMTVEGLKLMLCGYFKKMVIADRLAIYVDAVYDNYERHSGLTLILATVFYSIQIYADFSGYTDIALGSAKILGFKLSDNFRRPYFATSVREFWNRWHITLSVWLRDYLFLPLAVIFAGRMKRESYLGIKTDKLVFMVSVMITFAVCGLWHGESFGFLVWGLLFGVYLTAANWSLGISRKINKRLHISSKSLPNRIFNIAFTFLLVTFTWIFFRADNFNDSLAIIKSMSSLNGPLFVKGTGFAYCLSGMILFFLIEVHGEIKSCGNLPFRTGNWMMEHLAYAAIVLAILLTGVFDGGQFIYFKF